MTFNKLTENNRIHSYPDEFIPKKRNIEGYEEKICIEFAGKYVVLAENQTYPKPYLICNIKYDNLLNFEERYNGAVTDNYIEAMREFISRIGGLVSELETERCESGLPFQPLTAAEYCIPNNPNSDWEDKLIIVKPEILAPEYRSAEHQLVLCTGGNGARAESLGTKVYVKELYSGKNCYYRRHEIAGLADLSKLPNWAIDKLLEYHKRDELNINTIGIELNEPQHKKVEMPENKSPKNKAKPCLLIIHGNTDEINIAKFSSISEAKKYANECDIKNYSIKPETQKSTLQNKLDNAKEKAATQNSEHKNKTKSKKRNGQEVE